MLQGEARIGAGNFGQPSFEILPGISDRASLRRVESLESPHGQRIDQVLLAGKMAARRGMAHAQLAAQLPQRHALQSAGFERPLRRAQQGLAQISMMVGTGKGFHPEEFTPTGRRLQYVSFDNIVSIVHIGSRFKPKPAMNPTENTIPSNGAGSGIGNGPAEASDPSLLGGSFTLPGASMTVHRLGYGAMQLAGPGVWGPPRDPDAAVDVLREAIAAGVNHIDTSDFYGPHVTNQIIKKALHPYADGLVIVTKVGARRGNDKSWIQDVSRQGLIDSVHDNLRNLGLDRLDVVNLRVGGIAAPTEGSIEEPLTVLAELKAQGLIDHLGLSNVTPGQLAEAQKIAEIVCVQNLYNVAHRGDDAFIDNLAEQGIAYVPFFPLGGFSPLQSSALDATAAALHATPMQVALAWLLHRSPNIMLIPGTSSVEHLRENLKAATLQLPPETLTELEKIATQSTWKAH
jgi:pyridoxine 4-dehydrogenase